MTWLTTESTASTFSNPIVQIQWDSNADGDETSAGSVALLPRRPVPPPLQAEATRPWIEDAMRLALLSVCP